MKCRHCKNKLEQTLIDLGISPPSNSYLSKEELCIDEKMFPLKVYVCNFCWLVQTFDTANEEDLFTETYSYFSSYSDSWLNHLSIYVKKIVKTLELNEKSLVIEVASNDGCLLEKFKERNIPCFGIEPTKSTAKEAKSKGIDVYEEFFTSNFAQFLLKENKSADLIIANNVLAHVPDINDFLKGFVLILKDTGTATFEFPHLVKLINFIQFDTIYHEHFSYLSFLTCQTILKANGLEIYDVEEINTHGGSIRVYAQKIDGNNIISTNVSDLIEYEVKLGVSKKSFYEQFWKDSKVIKDNFLNFLNETKLNNKKVIAYGAAAKGNTFLNYSKIDKSFIKYVVDKNPMKQGKFLPQSHIPVFSEERIMIDKPDFVIILPWNLKKEIASQLSYINQWGGKFVTFQPIMEIF